MKKKSVIIALLAIATAAVQAADLFTAIATVESNGNDYAVGDRGRAIGRYQLWKVYVDDVNRIAGTSYTYADRTDPEKALQMVKIYIGHYAARYERLTGKTATDEVKARLHNGGPNGYKKGATIAYWNKVKKEMGK